MPEDRKHLEEQKTMEIIENCNLANASRHLSLQVVVYRCTTCQDDRNNGWNSADKHTYNRPDSTSSLSKGLKDTILSTRGQKRDSQ
jgi:hypothetical protein